MGALLALGASVLWGVSDFVGGTASRRLSAFAVVFWGEGLAFVVLAITAVATGGLHARLGYLPWACLAGVMTVTALTSFYTGLSVGTMGVVAPIAALGVVIPVTVGLAGGDHVKVAQAVGLGVAVVGVVLVSGPDRAGGAAARRSLLLAATAAVGFGVVIVSVARGSRFSPLMTLAVMRGVTVLVILVVRALGRASITARWSDWPTMVTIAVFDAGANTSYAFSSRHGMLALVAVLASLYPAVTVLLARVIHDERLRRVQLVGVVGTIAGAALLAS